MPNIPPIGDELGSAVNTPKNVDYDQQLNVGYDIDLGGLEEYGNYDDEDDEDQDCK